MFQYDENFYTDIIDPVTYEREMNQKFKDVLALKEFIKKDNIKDGIPLTSLAWALYKENDNDLKKAKDAYTGDKTGFAKKYEKKVAERAKK